MLEKQKRNNDGEDQQKSIFQHSEENHFPIEPTTSAASNSILHDSNPNATSDVHSEGVQDSQACPTSTNTKMPKKRQRNEFQHLDDAVTALRDISCVPKKDNEFEIFGKSVAAQLEVIPKRMAYELQQEIQELITNKKLLALAIESNTDDSATSERSNQSIWVYSSDNQTLSPASGLLENANSEPFNGLC